MKKPIFNNLEEVREFWNDTVYTESTFNDFLIHCRDKEYLKKTSVDEAAELYERYTKINNNSLHPYAKELIEKQVEVIKQLIIENSEIKKDYFLKLGKNWEE